MLIDDWAPDGEDWFNAELSTWHHQPGDAEQLSGLEESAKGDHVLQVLSDATGTAQEHFRADVHFTSQALPRPVAR